MTTARRRFWLSIAILCCLAVTLPLPGIAQTGAVIDWIQDQAFPILSVEPTDDMSDLEPLREIVGDARIVGLGEQTHGTHEFVTMKHRIIRFLVEEMGFTALALEDSWSGGLLADRYVVGGKGTRDDATRAFEFWTYRCDEFIDIVRWMRSHNLRADQPVHLVGIDNKAPHLAPSWFRTLLPYTGEPFDAAFLRDVDSRLPLKAPKLNSDDPEVRAEGFAFLQSLVDEVFAVLPEIEDGLTPLERATIQHIPRAIAQVHDYAEIAETELHDAGWWVPAVFNFRDACMAENTLWWLDQLGENSRIIVYAHNGHVVRGWPETQSVHLGEHLSNAYGEEYIAIGFSTCEGTCTAMNPEIGQVGDLSLPGPSAGSYESVLCRTERADFFVDLRTLEPETAAFNWMNTPREFKAVGSLPDVVDGKVTSAYAIDCALPVLFDVLVHIEVTSPLSLDGWPHD